MRLFASFLLLFLVSFSVKAQHSSFGKGVEYCAKGKQLSHKKTGLFQKQANLYSEAKFSHLKAHWTVDPSQQYISGDLEFTLTPNFSDNELVFDCHDNLVVDSVWYNNVHYAFSQNNHKLSMTIPLEKDVEGVLRIKYEGDPPTSGFGSFMASTHDGAPVVSTLSEPFGADDWWPVPQQLNYKFDSLDIYLTFPKQYRSASNGLLQADSLIEGSLKTEHWKHLHPINYYLIAIAVTNYREHSFYVPLSRGDSVWVQNLLYPEDIDVDPYIVSDVNKVWESMWFFDSIFGDYPFKNEKYGHASFEGSAGAMEHQTMSSMGTYHYEIIVHELAHQWFGDYVTCGTWGDIWLNEGFATYLTGLVFEYYTPEQFWPGWLDGCYASATKFDSASVFVHDTLDINRLFSPAFTYRKGAYVLHTLRKQVGDEVFFEACRKYLNTYANSFAKTPDFQAIFEEESGKDLSNFFEGFIYTEGFPTSKFTVHRDTVNNRLQIISEQQNSWEVDFNYELTLPILVTFTDSTDSTLVVNLKNKVDTSFFYNIKNIAEFHIDTNHNVLAKFQNEGIRDAILPPPPIVVKAYSNDIILAPNPANEYVELLNLNLNEKTKVTLFSLDGKNLYSKILPAGYNVLNIEKLKDGVYFVEIKQKRLWVNRKLVVQ